MTFIYAKSAPEFKDMGYAEKIITDELDKLSEQCQDWERTEYKTATARLYDLLAQIYDVYEQKFVKTTNEKRRTLRNQLVGRLNTSGMQVRKSTDTLGVLIRYVFKADRRRVMSYKKAIVAAKSHAVLPADLVQWLTKEGGIEEVSKKADASQDALNRQKVAATAYNSVVKQIHDAYQAPLATVNLQSDASGSEVMMLAKRTGKGQFNIVYVFDHPGDGVKKTLINKAATKNLQDQAESKAVADEAQSFAEQAPINETELAIAV